MRKIALILVIFVCSMSAFGQTFTKIFNEHIRTLRVERKFLVLDNGVVDGSDPDNTLHISFDEMSHDVHFYTYSVVRPYEYYLSSSEYLQGFTTQDITTYEHSLTFTIFVFLQFWNLFNAKAFHTGKSGFSNPTRTFGGFELALVIILIGQFLIITIGGEMFSVEPLKWQDWLICFIGTSPVIIIGELIRYLKKEKV